MLSRWRVLFKPFQYQLSCDGRLNMQINAVKIETNNLPNIITLFSPVFVYVSMHLTENVAEKTNTFRSRMLHNYKFVTSLHALNCARAYPHTHMFCNLLLIWWKKTDTYAIKNVFTLLINTCIRVHPFTVCVHAHARVVLSACVSVHSVQVYLRASSVSVCLPEIQTKLLLFLHCYDCNYNHDAIAKCDWLIVCLYV